MATRKKTLEKQVDEFKDKCANLNSRGYIPIMTIGTSDNSYSKEFVKSEQIRGEHVGALDIGGELVKPRSIKTVEVTTCGSEGKGYVEYGYKNLMPVTIAKLAQSLPTTARCLEFITELLSGAGTRLMYNLIVDNGNGSVSEKKVPFEIAGEYLKRRIAQLRKAKEEADTKETEPKEAEPNMAQPNVYQPKTADEERHNEVEPKTAQNTAWNTAGGVELMSYRRKASDGMPKVDTYADKTYDNAGSIDEQIDEVVQELRWWERTMVEWQAMKNRTDFDVLTQQWANDDAYYYLSHLLYVMERGTTTSWGKVETSKGGGFKTLVERPKILSIDYVPTQCCRMEQMDERLKINYIYYAEKWRFSGTIKDQMTDMVAYHNIMPNKRWRMMEDLVMNNQRATAADLDKRSTVVAPVYVPQTDSPYYPVAPWWGIFSSLMFNLADSIFHDAATERRNSANLAQIVYINQQWLDNYLSKENLGDDEEKIEKAKSALFREIKDFLSHKSNKGGALIGESFVTDKDNVIKNIEVVNLPSTTSKANLEDIELVGGCIFFAFGIHSSLVGSFGKSAGSTSGTQQRELTLLKQCQLSPRQRLFLGALNFVRDWNGWTPKCEFEIKQYVLTTLDASKTGIVES